MSPTSQAPASRQPCKPRRATGFSCSDCSSDDDACGLPWPGVPRAPLPQAAPGSAPAPQEAGSSASGHEQAQAQRAPQPGVLLRENSLYALADAWRDASDADDDAGSSDGDASLDSGACRLGQLFPSAHRGTTSQAEPAPGSAGDEPRWPTAPEGDLGQRGAGPPPHLTLQLPARLLQRSQRSLPRSSSMPASPSSRLGQLGAASLGGTSIARACSSGAEAPALRSPSPSLGRAASLGHGASTVVHGGGAEPPRSPTGSPGHLGLRRFNAKSLASRRDGSFCYRNEVFDTSDGEEELGWHAGQAGRAARQEQGEEEQGEEQQQQGEEEEEEVFASVLVSIAAPSSKRGGAAGAGGSGPKAGLAALPCLELLLWVPSVWLALACLALMAARAAGRRALGW
jgi:hypothetical protein